MWNKLKDYFLQSNQNSIHQFELKDLYGNRLPMSGFKGKKVLLVNVASNCGLTPQYAELQQLYSNNLDRLVVIGLPCNDFAEQEPGSSEEIATFCSNKYNVTFPLTEKVNIKSDPIHPLYQFLTKKSQNLLEDSEVEWNFQKYLVDEKGKRIAVFKPPISPMSDEIKSMVL